MSSSGCPATLKQPPPRTRSRRTGSSINDVAVGILASRFAVVVRAERARGQDAGREERRAPPHARRAEGASSARARHSASETINDLIVETLSERLGKDTMASYQRQGAAERRQGPRRDHRRRQLRQLAAAGRRVLQGRAGRQVRPRAHARQPRRLPRPRRRVRRRVRRDEGQGRQGPRRRDLGAPERHDQVRRRQEDRHQGQPRHDARRHRQVPLAGRREGAGRDRRRRRHPQGAQRRRRRQLPPRRLGGWRRSGTPSRSSRRAARW